MHVLQVLSYGGRLMVVRVLIVCVVSLLSGKSHVTVATQNVLLENTD